MNTAGFAIPAYYSLEALFSSGKSDDTQWLTVSLRNLDTKGGNVMLMDMQQYWVVYASLTVLESAINAVYWFPFYYVFKFILVLWMALPQTG